MPPRSALPPDAPSDSLARRVVLVMLLAYMGMVFALSHMSKPPLPAVLSDLSDKVLHAAEYLPLGYLCARAFRGSARRRAVLGLLAAALFGLSDEFHQSFIPGRESSLWDWTADLAGSAAGASLLFWNARRGERKKIGEMPKAQPGTRRS